MDTTHGPVGYWYESTDDGVVELLEALQEFRAADEDLRRRASRGMAMNVSDAQALRLVVAAELSGTAITPGELARALAMSTASVTKLLDRLTASGHVHRRAHPGDRRSVVVESLPAAHEEIRRRLGPLHAAMAQAARAVPEHCRGAVAEFVRAVTRELRAADVDDGRS